jgi:hypothetical protein
VGPVEIPKGTPVAVTPTALPAGSPGGSPEGVGAYLNELEGVGAYLNDMPGDYQFGLPYRGYAG